MKTQNRSRWAFALLVVTLLALGVRDFRSREDSRQLQAKVGRLHAELKGQEENYQKAYLRLSAWEAKYPQQAEIFRKQAVAAEAWNTPPLHLEQRGVIVVPTVDFGMGSLR